MIKLKKETKIIAAVIFGFCVILLLLFFFLADRDLNADRVAVNVYFFNPATLSIEPEVHHIEFGSNSSMAQSVFDIFLEGPRSNDLVSVLPENITILDAKIVSGFVFEIEFSTDYLNLPPSEELVFRGSLVRTMTELDFISDVNFFIDGFEFLTDAGNIVGHMNRTNLLIGGAIPSSRIDATWANLYFKEETGDWLVPENRRITAVDRSLEFEIISEIINGPGRYSPLRPTISSDVTLIDATVNNNIAYVNLSSDFLPGPTDRPGEFQISVYSIVNSLTNPILNNEIHGVQFLIESEQITEIHDGIDLANPFTRNEMIIFSRTGLQ